MIALVCQPVESTSLSKFWFQMSTCTPTAWRDERRAEAEEEEVEAEEEATKAKAPLVVPVHYGDRGPVVDGSSSSSLTKVGVSSYSMVVYAAAAAAAAVVVLSAVHAAAVVAEQVQPRSR